MEDANGSRVIRCRDYDWESVPRRDYKEDGSLYRGVHRCTLVGGDGHGDAGAAETRYFEVEPGGYTSYEYHRHPHTVVVIRGEGEVILGNEVRGIGLHDVVYVAPDTPHQFQAGDGTPLGFLCIVDRDRDRPTIPDEAFIREAVESEAVRSRIRR